MKFFGKHRLVPHPDFPPRVVRTVSAEFQSSPDGAWVHVTYRVEPAVTLVLPDHPPRRLDGLWQSTCLELFAKDAGGKAYREFNFAPSAAWNAYAFTDWRRGMRPIEMGQDPHLVDIRIEDRRRLFPEIYEMYVTMERTALGKGNLKGSLTAVIEETDGTKSYWALAHPPGKPDFHHPDCFVLGLPAPPAP